MVISGESLMRLSPHCGRKLSTQITRSGKSRAPSQCGTASWFVWGVQNAFEIVFLLDFSQVDCPAHEQSCVNVSLFDFETVQVFHQAFELFDLRRRHG